MPPEFSIRKSRSDFHRPPPWVPENAIFFITINCQNRRRAKLTLDETSKGLLDSFWHYQELGKWHISLTLLMPDHLHALLCFNNDQGLGMGKVIKSWKRYTARAFAIDWQRDYFDHRIRSENDMTDKWNYIRENPVRAGHVNSYEKWSHVLRGDGTKGW
jgi:putative transposase